ncbi:MAG: copper resistance protein NlpE [Bacteroidota bacterium]|jgi:lipoprotein
MKKSFFVMAAAATMFAMGLVSCGNKQNSENQEATTDTVVVAEPAPAPISGTFEGTLPCADCSGIKTELVISEDGKFKLTETYMAKKEKQFVSEGEIVRGEGGRFSLTDKDGTVRQYELTDNTIAVLDAEGKKAEGELADKYILTKKM